MTMNYMYELGLPLNLFKLGLTQLQNWENIEGDLATSHIFYKNLLNNIIFAIYIQINCISL